MDDARRLSTQGRWLAVVLWTLTIYLTVPFVRTFQEWVRDHIGQAVFGYGVMAAVMLIGTATAVILARSRRRPPVSSYLWLVGIAAAFVWWTLQLWGQPEEAVHFLEYGSLGALVYRALRPRVDDWTVYLSAVLVGSLIGTSDEILQWVTPGRYWDFRDIGINAGSVALTQLAIWRVIPASGPSGPVSRSSLRLLARLAVAQVAVLTACLANTPGRVAWYSQKVPGLGALASADNEMAEYGHLVTDHEIGRFKSRFTADELRRIDRERGREAAAIVDQYTQPGSYGAFLKDYPSSRDPFVHEVRVHLFSRDQNRYQAQVEPATSAASRHAWTVAYRENQILETFFSHTLAHCSLRLSEPEDRELDERHDPSLEFESKVGRHLITSASERQLRIALLALAVALVVWDRRLGRQAEPSEDGRPARHGR